MTMHLGVRIAFFILTLLAPFVFPWEVTALLALGAGLLFPPVTVFVGFIMDILYFSGHGLPVWTVAGLIGCGLCYAVRYLVRTRIM